MSFWNAYLFKADFLKCLGDCIRGCVVEVLSGLEIAFGCDFGRVAELNLYLLG